MILRFLSLAAALFGIALIWIGFAARSDSLAEWLLNAIGLTPSHPDFAEKKSTFSSLLGKHSLKNAGFAMLVVSAIWLKRSYS